MRLINLFAQRYNLEHFYFWAVWYPALNGGVRIRIQFQFREAYRRQIAALQIPAFSVNSSKP